MEEKKKKKKRKWESGKRRGERKRNAHHHIKPPPSLSPYPHTHQKKISPIHKPTNQPTTLRLALHPKIPHNPPPYSKPLSNLNNS